ncbi:MAG: hypothetical protein HQK70_02800 [Desulfamplus sp.]|nr:hypothetical protein [Desulfamplus sp.]
MKKKMMICFVSVMFLSIFLLTGVVSAGVNPPPAPVKLIFIHHSTGGNWLSDPDDSHPYGGLGRALMDNNYYVSATNYGWGTEGIGDRTDIPNWTEWFTGSNSIAILSELFKETGQNFQEYGEWPRLADPGGENSIILMKSCFPNSDLFGNPYDEAASEINDQYTVSNAKAVYNALLAAFAAHKNKLFVIITAPPQTQELYANDYQTPTHRAANARAFNNWLVNDWLKSYPYKNVAVFDYFNVLTDANNHHRYANSMIEHVTVSDSNMSAYPTDVWDAHPNTEGQQKATVEFVPMLNYYYNEWKSGGSEPDPNTDIIPVADLKINGADSSIVVSAASPQSVNLAVGIDAGTHSGVHSDWWVVHFAPGNIVRSFNLGLMDFTQGLEPVMQIGLLNFQPTSIAQMSDLELGNHIFCFGVDMTANALPDTETLCYDCLSVEVTE